MIKKYYKKFKHWMNFCPPGALSSAGWHYFNNEFAEKAPIRWFFYDTIQYYVTNPIRWKVSAMSEWVIARIFFRHHIVPTGMKPGFMVDSDRILYSNFNLLKLHVERALARRTLRAQEINESWCAKHMPFYRYFIKFESPELGIRHLDWCATLDDPTLPIHERCDNIAIAAREIKELYLWWINRKSPDYRYSSPMDVWEEATRIETEMLVRLMKIRTFLD